MDKAIRSELLLKSKKDTELEFGPAKRRHLSVFQALFKGCPREQGLGHRQERQLSWGKGYVPDTCIENCFFLCLFAWCFVYVFLFVCLLVCLHLCLFVYLLCLLDCLIASLFRSVFLFFHFRSSLFFLLCVSRRFTFRSRICIQTSSMNTDVTRVSSPTAFGKMHQFQHLNHHVDISSFFFKRYGNQH